MERRIGTGGGEAEAVAPLGGARGLAGTRGEPVDHERAALLAELAALGAELGAEQRLEELAALLARRVGDLCVVELLAGEGRTAIVASAARGPGLPAQVRTRSRPSSAPAADARGIGGLAEGGRSSLVQDPSPEALEALIAAAGVDPGAAAALRARAPRSVIVAPLLARGRTIGAVTLACSGERRLGERELALLEEALGRAAPALDDALRYGEARATSERLRLLQEGMARLVAAPTPDEVAEAALEHAGRLLGARSATVFELDGDELAVLARDRRLTHAIGRWRRVALRVRAPVTDAARGRRPIWLESLDDWRERYPDLADEAEALGFGAAAALPLTAGQEVLGAIALSFAGPRRLTGSERDAARMFAEACGQSLARTRLRERAEAARADAELMADVSLALDSASGVDERLARLAELLVPTVADLVTVRLSDPGGGPVRVAAVAGPGPAAAELVRQLDELPDRPRLVDATAEPRGAGELDDGLVAALRAAGLRSCMRLPLRPRGTAVGAINLVTTAESGRRYRPADLALGAEIAHRAALAVDNARAYEAAQEARAEADQARRRTERLQRVTAALAVADTEEEVARAVVGEAMQALSASAGTVAVRRGGGAEVLVVAGYPPDLLRPGMELPADARMPLAHVIRTGQELWLEAGDDWTSLGFERPGPGQGAAGIGLPLRIGGEVAGAIAFRFGQDRRAFSAGDRALALAMSGQCAQAMERVRLYTAERHTASVLQRALLPGGLPPRAAASVEVRYLPAGGSRSGGDFFDVLELEDGRLSLVVGDVVGHGIEAAAVMGQLRSGWRAFALDGAGPGEVVRRLSRFAERVEGAAVATVACAVLDGAVLRYACAGHPPPLIRHADGVAGYLMDGRGPPLAVLDHDYREGRVTLEPGAMVLLYTDGLIERHHDLDRGMADLVGLVAGSPPDPGALLTRLVEEVGSEPDDDCAMLALKAPAAPAPLRLTVRAVPDALGGARAGVRRWLAAAGVDGGLAEDVVVCVSEALANSVEHAYADRLGDPGPIELEIAQDDEGALSVVVSDAGRWRPPAAEATARGRGLRLIRALMASVEVRPGEAGTIVRMRSLPAVAAPVGETPGRREPQPRDELGISAAPGEAVRLDGDLDEATAGPLAARLHLLAIERGGTLVVDLTDVRHIGSAGIRMLSQLADDLRREGGALEVVAPPGTMARRILDLTGLAATILPPRR